MFCVPALFFFFATLQIVECEIYLFNTEDGISVEFYDCVIIDTLAYCRRPEEPLDLIRDKDRVSCESNGGQLHSFSTLHLRKINISSILHEWKSSVERVEQYSRYRRGSRQDDDGYLCQCNQSESFGKNCEYKLPDGTTIDQTLRVQLKMKGENPNEVQKYGDIICYKGVECDYGQLCLDWRDICDGIQHCMFGLDENNCDILELNRCADDEYRCMNGMCIPDEYFVDGQYDCLDWSDEIPSKEDASCYFEMANVQCDDRMCPPNEWSCGDGQCIVERLEYQRSTGISECSSRREQYFMCETSALALQWTMPNGRCLRGKYEESSITNRTEYEKCAYLLKCALSGGLGSACPCWFDSRCTDILNRDCRMDTIQYPSKGILGPYAFFLFNRKQDWSDRAPRWVVINGTINCRGSFIPHTETIQFNVWWNSRYIIEFKFCRQNANHSVVGSSIYIESCYRSNDSFDGCNESRKCLSNTRVKDGFSSCVNYMDETAPVDVEKSCVRVKAHRFRCSVVQSTCLSIMALGNRWKECENGFDQLWFGTGRKLSEMNCNEQRTDECATLRRYIEQSWSSFNNNKIHSQLGTPFHWYCDSFWDLSSGEDENIDLCRQWWICVEDEWRCRTGQCILQTWLSDNEWDCADASDEESSFHRRIEILQQRNPSYSFIKRSESLFGICNKTHPFVCLSEDTSSNQYKCLEFTQLGDKKIDCLGAIDERHTLQHCDGASMLGPNFKCASDTKCISYLRHSGSDYRCPNRKDDEQWFFHRNNSSSCDGYKSFVCFDGSCIPLGRCDHELQCLFGEDEYMCDYKNSILLLIYSYRDAKESDMKDKIHPIQLPCFPNITNSIKMDANSIITQKAVDHFSNHKPSPLSSIVAYRCNRGLGVLSANHSIVCFCPPQYYGNYCQYHSDRFLLLLHLNLTQSIYSVRNHPESVLKVLLLFFFENQVLMTNQFQLRPALEINKIYKKNFHFIYSHSSRFRQERIKRYFNRSSILRSHPYSIRIEIYETQRDEQVSLIAVWQYPIDFDHLPVFRLAKVLHLTKPNPCSTNPCHPNEQCEPMINDKSNYLCLCKSNFTGPNCSIEDTRCKNGFCAANALCKPDYQSYLQGNHSPYCICPFNRYGIRCDIEHDYCQTKSCLNSGTCLPGSTIDQVTCLCQDDFYGSHCQHKKAIIRLFLWNYTMFYSAVVLQYFMIDYKIFSLILAHQQVYTVLLSSIEYGHEEKVVPAIVLAKTYSSYKDTQPNFYLLSLHTNAASLEGTTSMTEQNRCPSISELTMKRLSPIGYHQICIKNVDLLCFHDNSYLCACNANHTRVECFVYDPTLDRCSSCLAGGLCLRGDSIRSNDFICLCPSCDSGRQCQFNSKSLTVTLEQLFYPDLTSSRKQTTVNLIIVGTVSGFLIGLPNNLFAGVTFQRPSCRHTGVGHYLLYMSLINQINLGFLAARLTHLSVIIADPQPFSMINHVLCKLLNYFLVCFTRVSYWFTSFVGLERAYTVIFLHGQWFKKPKTACRLMTLTLVLILLTSSYELVFVKLFTSTVEHNNNALCLMDFPISHRNMWIFIHQTISIAHSVLPLIINICSTMTIICIIIKNKMNIHGTIKCKLFSNLIFVVFFTFFNCLRSNDN